MKPGLIQEKISYYVRCALILEVVIDENKINKLNFCLAEKQAHVMHLPTYFYRELIIWRSLCMQKQNDALEATIILKHHADATFSRNTQQLLRMLCVIPLERLDHHNTLFFTLI